MIKGTKLH